MMVCAFWSIVLILDWSAAHDKLRLWLWQFMVVAMLLYVGHAVFFNHYTTIVPFTNTLYCACNLLVFPLYHVYIKGLSVPHYLDNRRQQWHDRCILFLPALVISFIVGILYLMMSSTERSDFIETYLYHNEFSGLHGTTFLQAVVHQIAKLCFAIQVIIIFILGFRNLRQYKRFIDNTYADTENKRLEKVQIILILFIVGVFLAFVSNIIGRWRFMDNALLLAIPSLFFSILLFMIGYIGSRTMFSISNVNDKEFTPTSPNMSGNDNEQTVSSFTVSLEQLMNKQQLYLRNDLKISDVALLLGSNRTYIQRSIMELSGESFTKYINRKRIEYAIELQKNHPEYNIETIATQSGYTHLGTFYRNYKIVTGKTPRKANIL
jgi:AraC-like DNA-binding protein